MAYRPLRPTFPGFDFQGAFGQALAGLAPARLGDEIRIPVLTQVIQVGGGLHPLTEGILPEIGMGEGP